MRRVLLAGMVIGLAVLAGGGSARAEGEKLDMPPGAYAEIDHVAVDYETLRLAVACRLRDEQWHREVWPLLRTRAQEAVERAVRSGADREFARGFMRGASAARSNMAGERIGRDRAEACRDLQRIRAAVDWLDDLLR